MKIEFEGNNFAALKSIAEHILGRVADARSFKDLPQSGTLGSNGSPIQGYSVICTCPVELRIKALREEADELERSLSAS